MIEEQFYDALAAQSEYHCRKLGEAKAQILDGINSSREQLLLLKTSYEHDRFLAAQRQVFEADFLD